MKKRIIPCLDIKNGRVVKGINFAGLKDAGDPVMLACAYEKAGADELVLLDIQGKKEERKTLLCIIQEIKKNTSLPLIFGGGVKTLQDMEDILSAGADKVSINTGAVLRPELIREAKEQFPHKGIVVAIDAKKTDENNWEVYIGGGQKGTGIDALAWAQQVAALGASEILLTSIDRDGTQDGYDLELTRRVREESGIPVIASGGAGTLQHLYEGLTTGGADAVLAASIFHFGKITIQDAKAFLAAKGVEVYL